MYRVSQSFWIYNGRKLNEPIEGLYIGPVEKRSFIGPEVLSLSIKICKSSLPLVIAAEDLLGQSVLLSVVISKKINYYTFIASF